MEYLKNKTEKQNDSVEESKKLFEEIKQKLETEDKVKIRLDRNDFKKELSTNLGFGFQDLKKKYRLLASELVANYNVKFELESMTSMLWTTNDFSVIITVKNK